MNAAERNSVVVRVKSLGFISGERREAACRRGSERVERERERSGAVGFITRSSFLSLHSLSLSLSLSLSSLLFLLSRSYQTKYTIPSAAPASSETTLATPVILP